jgi:hypothetical protein
MSVSTVMRGCLLFAGAAVMLTGAAAAESRVDLELVLAVDVSLSMSPGELEIQRHGYAAALTHDDVLEAISLGAYGRIAVTIFEWAGYTSQYVIVPWTVIETREDAERVARQLSANPPNSARRTSISGAMEFGADLFAESAYSANKRVIDISGDGPNNQGPPVAGIRNHLIEQGITINGLPLMTNGGLTSAYDVPDLDHYYANCVIGGPGAFMVPVNDWSQFPEAIRRKLVMELAGPGSPMDEGIGEELPVIFAAAEPAYDCMIGEKLWRDRSWIWESR